MAQDTGYDFATGPTVTLLAADLVNGAQSAWTTAVDFGSPAPLGFGFELIVTGLASCIDDAALEIAWSHDNSDFSDDDNGDVVTVINCLASADAKKVGAYAIKARYAKFRLDNQAGGSIDGTSSNTALILSDIFADHA